MDTLKLFERLHPASAEFNTAAKRLRIELNLTRGATSKAVYAALSQACDDASVEFSNNTFNALVKAVSEAA